MQRLLVLVVGTSARYAWLVMPGGLIAAVLAALFALHHLGVTTDTDTLFSASLPWRQRQMEMARDFPQFQSLLVGVINAATPEEADATAAGLAQALQADKTNFRSVRRPNASPFFDREGLLFLSKTDLENLLNQTIDAQPFLGQLVADPTLRGLFAAVSLIATGVQHGQADLDPYSTPLLGFHRALAAAAAGHPEPLSWQRLLGGSLSDQAGQYRFVLVQPRLNYGTLEPGGAATLAMRAAAAKLPAVEAGRARVRITGDVALSDEEFASVAQGAEVGTIGSVILVILWLFLAVRSWRLIVPIVLTLICGLLVTTGFAGIFVGTLNLISVAFAILFVGLAVDFAIQFSVRFREVRREEPDIVPAMRETARRVAIQVLVAAAATAAGFLAFVPTDFRGVAELGLIAGLGMVFAFLGTVTFLPAALTLMRPRQDRGEIGFTWARRLDPLVVRARWPMLGAFGALALAGVLLLPHLAFDSNPLDTKNPNTEAMHTLRDLMSSPLTNPYSIDLLEPDAPAASAIAARLRPLPTVAQVITLSSFVPGDQQAKLAMIADAQDILAPTLSATPSAAPVTASDLRLAIKSALAQIDAALPKLPAGGPLALIGDDLKALQTAPDSLLLAANAALTRFLPLELQRLREALTAGPVTLASLPPELTRDWRLADGRTRVQVLPKITEDTSRGLHHFVNQVEKVAPDAGGSAVTIVATSDTILHAFRSAAIGALIAIAVILLLALRRLLDVALVLAPLLLGSLLTVVVMVVLPLPLNFANIIALPLLLGVGVSFNIYFVMNWRAGQRRPLGSATARAVVFSAFTTGTAFGSLALSAHPGTASMGKLLLLSLFCTLVATLAFVPALLAALPRPAPPRRVEVGAAPRR